MQRKEITLNGISTTNTYVEGDAYALLNLRKKNKVLMPVSPRKTVEILSEEWEQIFIHKNENYEHKIGVKNNEVWWIEGNIKLTDTTGKVSITQVGNMLNVLDDKGMHYILWNESIYKIIPPFTDLDITLIAEEKKDSNGIMPVWYHFKSEEVFTGKTKQDGWEQIVPTSLGLFNKQQRVMNKEGLLTGFVLACTAIELFDGSYVHYSMPVLLSQPTDRDRRYTQKYIKDTTNTIHETDYYRNPALLGFYTGARSYEPIYKDDIEQYDIITDNGYFYYGVPDKTVVLPEAQTRELQFCTTSQIPPALASTVMVYTSLFTTGCEIKLYISTQPSKDFKGVIKSISVFITPQVSMYNLDKVAKKNFGKFQTTVEGGDGTIIDVYNTIPEIKLDNTIIDELINQPNFYKVGEIAFDEIANNVGKTITIDLKGKLGDDLFTRKILPIDSNTRNKIVAKNQYVYNNRLHLFDYATELFKGFNIDTYYATRIMSEDDERPYNNMIWWTEVHIKTQSGISKVVRTEALTHGYLYNLTPMVSYPDRRAYKIIFYFFTYASQSGDTYYESNYYKLELPLTPHSTHNFAYYISSELRNIPLKTTSMGMNPVEENPIEYFPNGLTVSNTNNPLYFSSHNYYTIGTGEIFGMQSNRMNVSDRNFGMYPLFVATSSGWYMLTVGTGEIYYTNITPVATGEVPISKLMCATPFGIVFVGTRGLYLINSNGAKLITGIIEQQKELLYLEWNAIFDNVLIKDQADFAEYLKNISQLLYNPFENELIVVNANYGYNYVIDIDDKTVYLSTEKIGYAVQNSYPKLLVVDTLRIKDFSQSENIETHVSLITRPISFGTRDIKKIDRVFLRGLLHNLKNVFGKNSIINLWHSNDNVNYSITRGFTLKSANMRDIDMGLMARTKYRWYVFGFGATVNDNSTINSVEINVTKEYDNEKQR